MTPEYIILHHSLTKDGQTVSWPAIRKYHVNQLGWRDVGYHFGIEFIGNMHEAERQYEILMGRMLNDTGAHCKGMNSKSIGICFLGNYDVEEPPYNQWWKGVKLVRSLMEVFRIPAELVKGHCDFSPKSCPGKLFDMDKFRKDLT